MNKRDYDSALSLLEAVAATTPDFNYVFDLSGRFVYANRRLLEVWGTTIENAVGKSLLELGYPQWHAEMHLAELAQVIKTKSPITGEVPFTGGSGISGVYEYIFTPVLDVAGEVILIAGTTRDVTLRKAAQEQTLTILESISDGFFDIDSSWRFTYVNKQAEVILGKCREELLGQTIWDAYPGIVGSPFEETYRRAADQKILSSVTSYFAGHDRWYEAHASPTKNGISIYFRDVSERLRTEVALRESEERFRAAFDQSVVGIVLSDLNGKILSANTAFCRFVGRTIDELIGHDSKLFTHHDDINRNVTIISTLKSQASSSIVYEKRYLRKDGVIMEAQVSLTTVLDNAGEPISLVAIIEDLTQRKLIESERERLLISERTARSEAERASQMKDEFLATLSHELRTPLNAILGWAQILRKNKNAAKDISDGIAIIERNARAQTQIIEDLLDMSRIISGKLQLQVQRIDLGTVVSAAIDTVRPAAEAKGIKLCAVLDTLSAPVSGDPGRLQQVFWNLLTNAVKFTPKGGSVQVILERVNSHIEVSIIDTGEGINPDFLGHVFDRFRQGDGATTRRYGGLGLGLAIVKQLVELHGGTARAKSGGVGSGSTFTVELPLTVIHPEALTMEEKRHPKSDNRSLSHLEDTCSKIEGLKVLVVDDEPDARALVKRLLEDCKATVFVASTADEAVALLQSERPDIMVSDIGMPIEDGYSLIRRVRALPASQGGETPALALTAYARAQDRLNAMLAGFQSHVVKPVEPVELITLVAILAKRA